jgi:glutamyl-tRNA reductase
LSSGLLVLSADFRRTSSEVRQRFAESFDADWIAGSGLVEAMWLSTCNRVELYFCGSSDRVRGLLAERDGGILFGQGRSAVEHLFRVSSGLESAVLGESEIVAQLKDAWEVSRNQSLSGPTLNLAMRKALEAGKRVRTETQITRGVVSYATLAVREVSARIGGFAGKRVAVLGAGIMGERIIRELGRTPPAELVVWSRDATRAARFGFAFGDLEDARRGWGQADAVFACLSGSFEHASRGPVVADLGVPANLPPELRTIGMDEMVARCAANSSLRLQAVAEADRIIRAELDRYDEELIRRGAFRSIE